MTDIIFVGGTSASGKTTAAVAVASVLKRPVIHLDHIYNAIIFDQSGTELQKQIAAEVCYQLILVLGKSRYTCIVEGGWISPQKAAGLVAELDGIATLSINFCGYPGADAQERMTAIKTTKANPHWLCKWPDARALAYLRRQIDGSSFYRDACTRLGLAFFDFSDFADGHEKLVGHLGSTIK